MPFKLLLNRANDVCRNKKTSYFFDSAFTFANFTPKYNDKKVDLWERLELP